MSGQVGARMRDIRPLGHDDLPAVLDFDGSFVVAEVLLPELVGDRLGYRIEAIEPYTKAYDAEGREEELIEHLEDSDKAGFVAQAGERPVGMLLLSENWNGYALIDDILVDRSGRGRGLGKALVAQAIAWARQRELAGVMLETQHNNVAACRLYESCGFVLGGFDRYLYQGLGLERPEIALYWYLPFGEPFQ